MRTVGVVTTSRADFGIFRPVLRRILEAPALRLHLIVSGSHLSPDFGMTVREIEEEGLEIKDRVKISLDSDTPEAIAKAMGYATIGFAESFGCQRPDMLLVVGDRFEMHAAAAAAVPFTIPIAHIHGGETTQGAIDEVFRHSMTKFSHLHFVATEESARRVIQLGEEPWRVTVSGAPTLDNLSDFEPLSLAELETQVGMDLTDRGFLLVTFHPVTLEYHEAGKQILELVAALDSLEHPVVFTLPNADTAGLEIRRKILQTVENQSGWVAVGSLGHRGYFSAMAYAAAMVGNSSSGLIEAPSFGLPDVNIGIRQEGRTRGLNVVDCACEREAIISATLKALAPAFRASLKGKANPYGDGRAAERIVRCLAEVALDERLLKKRFHDIIFDSVTS